MELDLNEILTQSTVNTIENKSIFYGLQEILQQYDISFTNMLNLDRYNDACEVILTRSIPIWKRFARDTNNKNERKKYFSHVLRMLEQLTEILAERWRTIRTITSQNDVRYHQILSKENLDCLCSYRPFNCPFNVNLYAYNWKLSSFY